MTEPRATARLTGYLADARARALKLVYGLDGMKRPDRINFLTPDRRTDVAEGCWQKRQWH